MSLQLIPLRKLLMMMYLDARHQRAALLRDIREDAAKEAGMGGDGGDFYVPFWSDAKNHVLGISDLQETTTQRIAANARRRNLYPELRRGFLVWWNDRRRWTNAPFELGPALRAQVSFPDLVAVVRIDNILSVRDSLGDIHYVYPYFSPEPELTEEAARLGLWILGRAFPDVPHQELRILDVIRGQTFSVDRQPLRGNEEGIFQQRYAALIDNRAALVVEPRRRRR